MTYYKLNTKDFCRVCHIILTFSIVNSEDLWEKLISMSHIIHIHISSLWRHKCPQGVSLRLSLHKIVSHKIRLHDLTFPHVYTKLAPSFTWKHTRCHLSIVEGIMATCCSTQQTNDSLQWTDDEVVLLLNAISSL